MLGIKVSSNSMKEYKDKMKESWELKNCSFDDVNTENLLCL